jgi:hypothetical protein
VEKLQPVTGEMGAAQQLEEGPAQDNRKIFSFKIFWFFMSMVPIG